MNDIKKLILGTLSVCASAVLYSPLLLPFSFIVFSFFLVQKDMRTREILPYKIFSFLLAMSLVDRYDMSYGIINIFYVALAVFLIYQSFLLLDKNHWIDKNWLLVLFLSIIAILFLSIRPIINIDDVFKWVLLVTVPIFLLTINYKININNFLIYLKDINIYLIGIGLGQFMAILGLIPFSDAVGLDMAFHAIRPTGLGSEPTWYSTQLAILLGITYLSGLRLSKAYYLISLISIFIIFICFTRAAYLILILLAIFVIPRNLKLIYYKPLISLCVISVSSVVLYLLISSFGDTEYILNTLKKFQFNDASAGARIEGILYTINYWLEKPIVGHGFLYSDVMVTSEGTAVGQKIFNSFLASLAIGGLFLFFIYLSLFMFLVLSSFDIYLRRSDSLPLFLSLSYFILSSVMPFAYSFFGIFITMILITLITQYPSKKY